MKKILFTASTHSHIVNFHLPYLRRFRERGYVVHVACGGEARDIPYADEVLRLPLEKKMLAPRNLRAAALLREKMAEEGYALAAAHTSLAAFFTRLAAMGLPGPKRPRLVNMVHGYLFDGDTRAAKRLVLLAAEKLTAGVTDLVLTMNEWDFAEAKKRRLGRRVERIPGVGVDFAARCACAPDARDALRAEYGVPDGAFLLFYAAEFSARKSQKTLIEALRLLPEDVVLALAGSGAAFGECRELASALGVGGRVIFPGYVSDVAPWYAASDAAVTSSRSEGLPFNVMEAMYAGLPVAASAVKGHTDLIRDGETGLLFPYGDAGACAARIRELYESPEKRKKLAVAARESVSRCGIGEVLPVVMGWYDEVLTKPGSSA